MEPVIILHGSDALVPADGFAALAIVVLGCVALDMPVTPRSSMEIYSFCCLHITDVCRKHQPIDDSAQLAHRWDEIFLPLCGRSRDPLGSHHNCKKDNHLSEVRG